mgnify:CR=1 FL=1
MFNENHLKPNEGFKKTGYTKKDGYIMVWKPTHKYAWKNGYVKLHRLVMEKELGRYLKPNEVVHHKDGDKLNNDINNLQIMTKAGHRAIHNVIDYKGVLHYDIEEIKELYLEGHSTRDIARILGIGKSTVGNYIKQLGISRPQMSMRDESGQFKMRRRLKNE